MRILYEDNHIIVVHKEPGEIVQGDKTGDLPLVASVKSYIKEAYAKPGEVFLGVVHRLDRPVSGVVVFARTSKALTRMNELFRTGGVQKTYWAIVPKVKGLSDSVEPDAPLHRLTHWLRRNEAQNKSYAYDHEAPNTKKAELDYHILSVGDRYALAEIHLHTGRHHQIRCQLAKIGLPIKGDLKYGAPRSNPDGSISLMARSIRFIHPVSKQSIHVEAPLPDDNLWKQLTDGL